MKIAVVFVGQVHDEGFNASALLGAERASSDGLANMSIVSGISYDQSEIREAMLDAVEHHDGVVFIGGQGNLVTPEIATQWPDKAFAIVQGNKTGPNLSSYDVRQEESAFLAGALAARMTQTGTIGHLSGHRVTPGLKGRAAFAAGAAFADPKVKLLTAFCGTQDAAKTVERWALAEIEAGADIIFTMLNGARAGAIEACRKTGALQIGNALDWVQSDPNIFVASAMARIDLGVNRAILDMVKGVRQADVIEFGLAEGDFVALSMSEDVPAAITSDIHKIEQDIRLANIHITSDYAGVEFELDAAD
jgi:basic membrane protein A